LFCLFICSCLLNNNNSFLHLLNWLLNSPRANCKVSMNTRRKQNVIAATTSFTTFQNNKIKIALHSSIFWHKVITELSMLPTFLTANLKPELLLTNVYLPSHLIFLLNTHIKFTCTTHYLVQRDTIPDSNLIWHMTAGFSNRKKKNRKK
jgi:hypothetical protein